jgi:aspartate aminotransferase/aminotransferase
MLISDRFRNVKPSGVRRIFDLARQWGNNLFIIPGSVFSKKNTHVRISFAALEETLLKGIEVLNRIG